MTSLVLTIIGPDRVGLVGTLAAIVDDHGGNWVDSRLASLAGQFAGVVRVDVDDARAQELVEALDGLPGLRCVVQRGAGIDSEVPHRILELSLIGNDRPGIVRAISMVLARHEVNVEDLESECVPAPETGAPLFKARAELRVPAGVEQEAIRRSLEKLADDLMVELRVADLERG